MDSLLSVEDPPIDHEEDEDGEPTTITPFPPIVETAVAKEE